MGRTIANVTKSVTVEVELKDIDSADMINVLESRGHMPEQEEPDMPDLRDALHETREYDLLRHGIEDRDWKKIEEAAQLMGIEWFRARPVGSNRTSEGFPDGRTVS